MLTKREREIVQLLAQGLSAKELAQRLAIASRTVEGHIETIKLKTLTRNRTHLVAVALREGLLSPRIDDERSAQGE